MAELNIEYIRTCAANLRWSKNVKGSKGETYRVSYGPAVRGPYMYGWECTCKAGQFGRECKHIVAAKAQKCEWNHEAWMGSHADTNPDGTCPACGGPTEVIKVGV